MAKYKTRYGQPGLYNVSLPTIPDEQGSALAVDVNGRLIVVGPSGSSSNTVQGTAADNAASSGNPVWVAAKYFSAQQTYANGDVSSLQADVNGYLKTVEQYIPVYEDNTLGKAVVEHRYTSSGVLAADTLVKSGAGLLHTVVISCNDAAPTAGSLIIYDNTAESGTQIFNHTFTTTPFAPFSLLFDVSFGTGLYAGFTTTNDVNVTLSYR